uniref:Uncharacterized protein n=1 Tax=Acrobeloides nanus TaxID=290746 RepID=A0A914CPK5_9BILA
MTEVIKEVIMLAREMLQTWKQQQEFLLESFSEHMTLGKKAMLDSFDLKFQTLAKAIEGYESHIPDDQIPGTSQLAVFPQSSTNRYRRQEASQAYDSYGGFLQNYHAGSYGGAYGSGQFFGSYGSQYYPTQFSGASTFTQMGNKANMFGKGQGKIGTAGKVQKLIVKKSSTQQGGSMEGGSGKNSIILRIYRPFVSPRLSKEPPDILQQDYFAGKSYQTQI